jgi:nucleoside 2-deoxyribosyltransferase
MPRLAMIHRPVVYLAGPAIFQPDAGERYAVIKAACEIAGMKVLTPQLVDPLPGDLVPSQQAAHIRDANIDKIRAADIVLADVSPFRGPNAEDGTAWEMGFAEALGKIVVPYAERPAQYYDAVDASLVGPVRQAAGGLLVDAEGNQVEDFDLPCNLMLAAGRVAVQRSLEEAIAQASTQWANRRVSG